jgi:hypothetical protein
MQNVHIEPHSNHTFWQDEPLVIPTPFTYLPSVGVRFHDIYWLVEKQQYKKWEELRWMLKTLLHSCIIWGNVNNYPKRCFGNREAIQDFFDLKYNQTETKSRSRHQSRHESDNSSSTYDWEEPDVEYDHWDRYDCAACRQFANGIAVERTIEWQAEAEAEEAWRKLAAKSWSSNWCEVNSRGQEDLDIDSISGKVTVIIGRNNGWVMYDLSDVWRTQKQAISSAKLLVLLMTHSYYQPRIRSCNKRPTPLIPSINHLPKRRT